MRGWKIKWLLVFLFFVPFRNLYAVTGSCYLKTGRWQVKAVRYFAEDIFNIELKNIGITYQEDEWQQPTAMNSDEACYKKAIQISGPFPGFVSWRFVKNGLVVGRGYVDAATTLEFKSGYQRRFPGDDFWACGANLIKNENNQDDEKISVTLVPGKNKNEALGRCKIYAETILAKNLNCKKAVSCCESKTGGDIMGATYQLDDANWPLKDSKGVIKIENKNC